MVNATREERRRLLEASVAASFADYVVDQEWGDANLYGPKSYMLLDHKEG